MAIASVAAEYMFSDFLLRGPVETKYAGVRLELPWDKMVTFLAVGLPLFLISLSFAQEVSVGSQITCFAPQNFSLKQAAYVDSFCWAAVQHDQSAPLWLHKFFPYVLLLMAILVYIPTLIWRFTAAPQLSSDLKFIMKELNRCYKQAIEVAKKRVSSGGTVPADSAEDTQSVLEMTRGCLKYTLVEHYLKSKRSSRSLLVKYLACRVLTLVTLLLACAFLGYYIHLAFLSDEFSCDLRTGVLQNDSVVPSAVQCKLVAVGVFGLLSIINVVMYALLSLVVGYAFFRLKCQSSSFLQPYDILLESDTLGVIKPPYNDLRIYLLFLKENLSHVESFKRLQVLELFQNNESEPTDTLQLLVRYVPSSVTSEE